MLFNEHSTLRSSEVRFTIGAVNGPSYSKSLGRKFFVSKTTSKMTPNSKCHIAVTSLIPTIHYRGLSVNIDQTNAKTTKGH